MAIRFALLEQRLDRADITPEGYLQGRVNVTKCGVFPYRNKDGSIRWELRHPEDVFDPESLRSLELCPIQVEHVEMLRPENIDAFKVGHLGNGYEINRESETVSIPIRIDSPRGIAAVMDGKKELSMGYELELEPAPEGSSYKGKPYTHRQRNIRYNHLAITDRARLGSDLRLDSGDAVEVSGDPNPQKESSMLKKIRIDSVEYEVPPQVEVYVQRLEGRVDAMETELEKEKTATKAAEDEAETAKKENEKAMDGLRGELAAAKAETQSAKDALAALEKDIPARAAAIAKDRAEVMTIAEAVLPADTLKRLDSMDLPEIRTEIVKAKFPTISLDGKGADFLSGLYQGVCESIGKGGSNNLANSRKDSTPKETPPSGSYGTDGLRNDAVEAHQRMAKANQTAYLKPKLMGQVD